MKFSELVFACSRRFAKSTFGFWQRLGLHVVPNHFYEPIPDTRHLPDSLWAGPQEMPGVNMNDAGQLALLDSFVARFKAEFDAFPDSPTPIAHQYFIHNSAFASVDGEVAYCMARHFKPRRMIEIGSGFSTFVSAQALLVNAKEDPAAACDFTAVEPFPNPVIRAGLPGLSRLIPAPVQQVPLSTFTALGPNDILFIDSSHILKIGSDVHYEFLEVLPRLAAGVVVHVHDIFLPLEYPKDWIMKHRRFWNEQYILQAFLIGNAQFEVLFGGQWMHVRHPDALERAFRSYNRKTRSPGSFWMRKVA